MAELTFLFSLSSIGLIIKITMIQLVWQEFSQKNIEIIKKTTGNKDVQSLSLTMNLSLCACFCSAIVIINTSFQSGCTNLHSHHQHVTISIAPHPHQTFILSFFFLTCRHSGRYVVVTDWGFILHFLTAWWNWTAFHVFKNLLPIFQIAESFSDRFLGILHIFKAWHRYIDIYYKYVFLLCGLIFNSFMVSDYWIHLRNVSL